MNKKFSILIYPLILLGLIFLSIFIFKYFYMESDEKEVKTEKAMFSAGCFWGVEDTFLKTKGVVYTAAGFSGGTKEDPTYDEVSKGDTGHAETVYLEYDPTVISYKELLDIFWRKHNPTTPNRQGFDVGSQYRSIIFYFNDEQKQLAEQSKEELDKSGKYKDPVVTAIIPAQPFYKAEDCHQQYLQKGGVCY